LLSEMDKEYESVFCFGKETDTLDTEGEVVAEEAIPEYHKILKAMDLFNGSIKQIPPSFSAIKINGKRAYSQARKGLAVEIPERTVQIHDFKILSWNPPELKVKIRCSKGTYIRSIARDLGIASGSRAYCYSLTRSSIGPFSLRNAVTAETVSKNDGLTPIHFFESLGIPIKTLSMDIAGRLRKGFPVSHLEEPLEATEKFTLFTDKEKNPAALLELKSSRLEYRIVFDD